MDRNQYRNMALIVAMFILAFGVGTASAQHAAKAKADDSGANDSAANAQQVATDGKGHFRALTHEEAAELAGAMVTSNNTSTEGLKAVTLPNGAVAIDLEGRFESAEIVKVNPDGAISQSCVKTKEEAEKFLTSEPGSQPKAKPELETK